MKAQMKLFNYTGFAMLTYTIKQGKEGFEPVGEEDLAGKMTAGDESMLFICDMLIATIDQCLFFYFQE